MKRTLRMVVRMAGAVGTLSVALGGCASQPRQQADLAPWSRVTSPSKDDHGTRAIGNYSSGCLSGGVSLPPDGRGYQLMRITRRRFYGHPNLIVFIQKLGAQAWEKKLGPLLIGDMSQPRGGPMLSGHRSHQMGLDVDIWFMQPAQAKYASLTLDDRESLGAASMLNAEVLTGAMDSKQWSRAQVETLKKAASADEVDRIFVNPVIKRELCRELSKDSKNRPWLQKIRPWWGHDAHFHVRLKCPEDSSGCRAQEALPQGDGCDATLDWWFTAEARESADKKADEAAETLQVQAQMPAECNAVLNASPR